MILTTEERAMLAELCYTRGIDVVLRDLSYMIQDSCNGCGDPEQQMTLLINAMYIMQAADSITHRSYTGKDLYHENYTEDSN